jgi:hypothetical protein
MSDTGVTEPREQFALVLKPPPSAAREQTSRHDLERDIALGILLSREIDTTVPTLTEKSDDMKS